MHVLCGLRREQTAQCVPELRRRVHSPPDPARDRTAARGVRAKHPPSDKRVHLKYSLEDIAAHSARLRDIRPEDR
jgi:hypothetical protein